MRFFLPLFLLFLTYANANANANANEIERKSVSERSGSKVYVCSYDAADCKGMKDCNTFEVGKCYNEYGKQALFGWFNDTVFYTYWNVSPNDNCVNTQTGFTYQLSLSCTGRQEEMCVNLNHDGYSHDGLTGKKWSFYFPRSFIAADCNSRNSSSPSSNSFIIIITLLLSLFISLQS